MRAESPGLLLLSAGDFYARKGILEMYRSRFLANMMVLAGYDAVAVGENELSYELKAIREEAQTGLPVIPIVVQGSYRALTGKGLTVGRAGIRVTVLPAIEPETFDGLTAGELCEQTHHVIASFQSEDPW